MKNFLLDTVLPEKQDSPSFAIDNGYAFVPIQEPVGNGRRNREEDVKTIRNGLDKLNYATEDDQYPEIYTRNLDDAIKNFQTAENLKVDGVLNPKGETEQRLQSKLQEKQNQPRNKILRRMDDQRVIEKIKEEEGSTKHMYLDINGNPTVGIGFLLPDVETAKKYPFYKAERPAAPNEIEEEYNDIRTKPYGQEYGADHYKADKNIELKEEDVNNGLVEILQSKVEEVRKKFIGFDEAPDNVQLAILDMQFNLGDAQFRPEYTDPKTGKQKGWPKFFKAYQDKDWKEMARQSNRIGVSAKRNKDTYDLLYNAQ